MHILFDNTKGNMNSFLKELAIGDIEECCDSKTFSKGEDYYDNEYVYDVYLIPEDNMLTATVEGSIDYEIKIIQVNNQIKGSCTCPVGGVCKHIVAVLLFCAKEPENIKYSEPAKKVNLNYQSYLETLSKEELIELLVKFAPKQFFSEINNSFSNNKDAVNIFLKVQKAVQKLFSDYDLLYSPSDFEGALMKQFNLLKGLEKHLKKEIGELILYAVKEVEQAFDEGYLYLDGYYNDDDYFTSEDFEKYILKYAASLDFEEKFIFLQNLADLLNNQSYDTFYEVIQSYNEAFNENEIPLLKEKFLKNYASLSVLLQKKFYEIIKTTLSFDEKEYLLKELSENSEEHVFELAEILANKKRIPDAIVVLKKYIDKTGNCSIDEKIVMLYLDLLAAEGKDISDFAKNAIRRCRTDTMLLKLSQFNGVDIKTCEDILKKENPEKMLDYYEAKGRLKEALLLVKESKEIWGNRIYEFFKKYKKDFPVDAENFFCTIIDKNLLSTGDSYYQAIADALKQIYQIKPTLASEITNNIRKNYNRRRKLIQLINNQKAF